MISHHNQLPASSGTWGRITEGMDVVDATGEKIGTVAQMRFGDEDPTRPGIQTVIVSDVNVERDNDDLLFGDRRRDEAEAHLLREGFIRIDTGWVGANLFATLDQIADVTDTVQLHVTLKDLVSL